MADVSEDLSGVTLTVVLCCAEQEQHELSQLISLLQSQKIDVVLVTHVDNAPNALVHILEQYGASALYIFIESGYLSADAIAGLQQLAKSAGVEQSALLKTRFSAQYSVDFAKQILTYLHNTFAAGVTGPSDNSVVESPEAAVLVANRQRRRKITISAIAFAVLLLGGLWFVFGGDAHENPPTKKIASDLDATHSGTATEDGFSVEESVLQHNPQHNAEAQARKIPAPISSQLDVRDDEGKRISEGTPSLMQQDTTSEKQIQEMEKIAPQALAESEEAVITEDMIRDAVQRRKIRVLDTLLIARLRHRQNRFPKAEKFCLKQKIGQMHDWRLPTIGELRSLREAKMIKRAHYWSQTRADTLGDVYLSLEGGRGKIVPRKKQWRKGRTICVLNIEQQQRPNANALH